VERIRFRAAGVVLLLLAAFLNVAFARKKAPQFAQTVELPPSFDIDYVLATKQRADLRTNVNEVPDDVAGRVGADVFQSLVKTQMISSFGLPYKWQFRLYDTPAINAGSLADGEVQANTGLSKLIGTNRGLWAAVLAHEVAHVSRRHAIQKYLFHEYVEQQVRYWQMRAQLGDKGAAWAALAMQIAGNLAEKKLSRDMEHDADVQGMLLMARAGYHPDYAFAMHHLLRMNTVERSKIGTFFFSDHPRWESRDQRTEKAYADALSEYERLWPSSDASPGGSPPAIAFLGVVRGIENKKGGTGDMTLALSCRNVGTSVGLIIRLTKGDGTPVQSIGQEYRDPAGNVTIRERALCLDKDSAQTTIVHIPASVIPPHDRKLKAQIDVLGPSNDVLERSKLFNVHFPKADRKVSTENATVRVEPELPDAPQVAEVKQPTPASANAPAVLRDEALDSGSAATSAHDQGAALRPAIVSEELPSIQRPSFSSMPSSMNPPAPVIFSRGVPDPAMQQEESVRRNWWPILPSAALQESKVNLSPSTAFFPTQPVDTNSPPAAIVITNSSSAALLLTGLTIAGVDSSDFMQENNCGRTVGPGETCTLWVTFKPTANGTRTGLLTIGGVAQKVELTGLGK
jgi:Zn-dependent protease with chaperone function